MVSVPDRSGWEFLPCPADLEALRGVCQEYQARLYWDLDPDPTLKGQLTVDVGAAIERLVRHAGGGDWDVDCSVTHRKVAELVGWEPGDVAWFLAERRRLC